MEYSWLCKPQFFGVRAAAANIGTGKGTLTAGQFQQMFPQFYTAGSDEKPAACLVPAVMLDRFIAMANASIIPSQWGELWEYAAGLYVAHYATLYLRTYAESSATSAQAAASGALVGVVSSAKLGQDSVSYDTDALTKATEKWGDLNATQYGQLLATQARLAGMGGSYVI
jgi:hypothetical protein